jgi:arylsulfatase A-like enzyme
MSMFTSLFPSVHRVFTIMERERIHVLNENIVTLPELLSQRGFATVGFHGGGFVDGVFGFARGFDDYRYAGFETAEKWIEKNGGKKRFFLFFHTYHVHDPYTPKPPYDSMFDSDYDGSIIHDIDRLKEISGSGKWENEARAFWKRVDKTDPRDIRHLVALYDGAIAEMDQKLSGLLESIDRHAPRTVVIIVSDHGEEFGEHGDFKHQQPYNEILRVPLIIRHPDIAVGERVSRNVSLIDLAPTILRELGIESPKHFQGRPIDLRESGSASSRSLYAEYPKAGWLAVVDGLFKLIRGPKGDALYDLGSDPIEAHVIEAPSREREQLEEDLMLFTNENAALSALLNVSDSMTELDDDTIRQLRALGYLD